MCVDMMAHLSFSLVLRESQIVLHNHDNDKFLGNLIETTVSQYCTEICYLIFVPVSTPRASTSGSSPKGQDMVRTSTIETILRKFLL